MAWLMVILAILIILIGICAYIGNFFVSVGLFRDSSWYKKTGHKLFNPDNFDKEPTIYTQIEAKQNKIGQDFWENHYTSDLSIEFANETLWAREFKNHADSKQWVIAVHGYRSTGERDMSFPASQFSEKGFNVLIPDLGAHGRSTGNKIGMGWLEKNQIKEWVKHLVEKEGKDVTIILFGGSMGGASVLMASGDNLPEQVKLIISDCAYSSVYNEFSYLLKSAFHLPPTPILFFSNFFCKKRLGFSLKEASCIEQLHKNTLPILFIHGTGDKFVPFVNIALNLEATNGVIDCLAVPKAPHLSSWIYEEAAYFNKVFHFIAENN